MAQQIIDLAAKHAATPRAKLSLHSARTYFAHEDTIRAARNAKQSIAYSVGTDHVDYHEAALMFASCR